MRHPLLSNRIASCDEMPRSFIGAMTVSIHAWNAWNVLNYPTATPLATASDIGMEHTFRTTLCLTLGIYWTWDMMASLAHWGKSSPLCL